MNPPTADQPCTFRVATAATPGAIAVLDLFGPNTLAILQQLTGLTQGWSPHRLRFVSLAGIDEGLAVWTPGLAQLMPHGGPRVVAKLCNALAELGCLASTDIDPVRAYPEAQSEVEAYALHTIAQAPSPAAVPLLLNQASLWQADPPPTPDPRRNKTLNQLLHPPNIVLVGRPNAGKSTLTNALLPQDASIVSDRPGTTRDYVRALVHLPSPLGQVAVHWLDTPGLRTSEDPIEQRAIALAQALIQDADCLIVLREPRGDWPNPTRLPREPDLRVISKADQLTTTPTDADLCLSAKTGAGLDQLAQAILQHLELDKISSNEPWAFYARLMGGI